MNKIGFLLDAFTYSKVMQPVVAFQTASVMCELVKPGVGLSNLGNTCFANCVLQFMLHSTHITSCVLSHNEAGI